MPKLPDMVDTMVVESTWLCLYGHPLWSLNREAMITTLRNFDGSPLTVRHATETASLNNALDSERAQLEFLRREARS